MGEDLLMLSQVEILKKYHIRVRGHLGQHLLMDPNMVRKIVDGLGLDKAEPVLEIGPGLGSLTVELLSRGHPVLAIEKDKRFVEILQNEIVPAFPGQLSIVNRDILECDLSEMIRGREPEALHDFREKMPLTKSGFKVVSNLPYYISTPILFHLIAHRACFHSAVLMLQKEVAARMTAKPGTPDYGRLSVSASIFGNTETLFDVSPKCFLPAPEVTSRVIRYTFVPDEGLTEDESLPEIIRIAFSERRKTLLALLLKYWRPKKNRMELESIFAQLGFALNARGEELATGQFRKLAEALK